MNNSEKTIFVSFISEQWTITFKIFQNKQKMVLSRTFQKTTLIPKHFKPGMQKQLY